MKSDEQTDCEKINGFSVVTNFCAQKKDGKHDEP